MLTLLWYSWLSCLLYQKWNKSLRNHEPKIIFPVLIYLHQEFGHRNEKTSKDIRRSRAFAMFKLDYVSHRPSKTCFHEMWKSMELWYNTALEHNNQSSGNLSGQSWKDENDELKLARKDYGHEASEGNQGFIGNWTNGHLWHILARKLAMIYTVLAI